MRITNGIIQQMSMTNLQKNMREMHRAQQEVTTGRKLVNASDDPSGASSSMITRSSIRALEQYRRNVDVANSRTVAEETVLDQLSDVLIRARELAVAYGSDNVSADQRIKAALELEELLKETVSLANTKYGTDYLFAGTGANSAPYQTAVVGTDLHYTTTSPTGSVQIEVSSNNSVPANYSGVEVFEDTGLLDSLRDLAIAFKTGDGAAIRTAAGATDNAFDELQALVSAVGARGSSLRMTGANLDALKAGLQVLKSDVEDAELEESITKLMGRQSSYQAALMTTSRVIGMTLADYLR